MRVTRRFLAVAVAGIFLAVLGWVLDRPALLVGGAGIGAWLLTQQYQFVRAVALTASELSVDQTVSPEQPLSGESVVLSLRVRGRHRPLFLQVEARPPVALAGADEATRTIALGPDEESGEASVQLGCPVAGSFEIDRARVEIGDRRGLFVESFETGPTPTVAVQPRVPRDIHVGAGGETMATPYGSHPAGQGAGLEPAEIREYVPGDSARHIDWNATARFGEPYVREFDAETDRATVLLVDAGGSMGTGPSGETKLDYVRQIALGLVDAAADVGDPLGVYVVGDEGIEHRLDPRATPDQYPTVRRLVLDLVAGDGRMDAPMVRSGRRLVRFGESFASSPEAARQKATRLDAEDTVFGRRLRPYLETTSVYVERFSRDPLFNTAEREIAPLRGQSMTMLLTDDVDHVAVRETAELLRRNDNRVLVFLAPTVLYEPGGLGDLEASFERYVEFESFRRELHGMARVSAYEVGPRDRLDAVLSAGRTKRVERNRR